MTATDAPRPEPDASAFPAAESVEAQAEFLLEYAVLAPSSHNSQPWAFEVTGHEVRVYADESRSLPVADPDGRELAVSVGCALENLVVAAERFGLGSAVEYVTESGDAGPDEGGESGAGPLRHVATVTLDPAVPAESTEGGGDGHVDEARGLFDAITERRTNHRPFADRPVPASFLDRVRALATDAGVGVEVVTDAARRREVAALQARADERQFENPDYRAELGHWIGTGALGANWLAARIGEVAVRHLDLGDREGAKNSQLVVSAPAVVVLTTGTADPGSWLDVGRAFERVALAATSEGLAVHPMSQALEVPDLAAELSAVLELDGATPAHLFRLGYAEPDATRTPRRPVADVLR
jgi:nitroreductase